MFWDVLKTFRKEVAVAQTTAPQGFPPPGLSQAKMCECLTAHGWALELQASPQGPFIKISAIAALPNHFIQQFLPLSPLADHAPCLESIYAMVIRGAEHLQLGGRA